MGCWSGFCKCILSNVLVIFIIIGVVSGIALGITVRNTYGVLTKRQSMYLSFPGEIFMSMLKSMILPLIFSSIVTAIGSLDLRASWKIAVRSLIYYAISTTFAITLGVLIVVIIHPGNGSLPEVPEASGVLLTEDILMDLVRNVFPNNLIQAAFSTDRTVLIPPNASIVPTPPLSDWDFKRETRFGMNMLATVSVAIIFGVAFTLLGTEVNKPLITVFAVFAEAMIMIIRWVIWLSPIGILFLIAGKVAAMEDVGETAETLGVFTGAVMLGIFLHNFVTLPLMFFVATRTLPFRFMFNMSQAVLTGFGTSSSNATLPVTLRCLEEKNGVDPRLARFVMPLGTAINMNGTALYEAIAVIYLMQMHKGTNLSIGVVIVICITATLASIATAGIPANLMNIVMMLTVIGLPASDISYLLTIDWFLDRLRTVTNIMGDAMGTGLVAKISTKELENMDASSEV